MRKTRKLNGTPGNLALSYLSTLGFYDGGYMADWLNHIALDKNLKNIDIDILNEEIEPKEADIKPLKADLKKLREILKKELINCGLEMDFIKKAIMKFEIPIDNPRFKNVVFCYPYIEDENGKIYKPKKRIITNAYEVDFNQINKVGLENEGGKRSWIERIKEILSK